MPRVDDVDELRRCKERYHTLLVLLVPTTSASAANGTASAITTATAITTGTGTATAITTATSIIDIVGTITVVIKYYCYSLVDGHTIDKKMVKNISAF